MYLGLLSLFLLLIFSVALFALWCYTQTLHSARANELRDIHRQKVAAARRMREHDAADDERERDVHRDAARHDDVQAALARRHVAVADSLLLSYRAPRMSSYDDDSMTR